MWWDKLPQRLYLLCLRWVSRRYEKELDSQLSEGERSELKAIVSKISKSDKTFMKLSRTATSDRLRAESPALFELLDVKCILHNPFILPYRRPALRFCPPQYRELLTSTPVVTIPDFHFHASTRRFAGSKRAFVKVPFGLVFALGAIARAAFGVYQDLDGRRYSTLKKKLSALFLIAGNITAPTPALAAAVTQTMGSVTILSVTKPAHVMHVMGVFVLLHEFGHVALNHQPCGPEPTRLELERAMAQEFEADAFALASILRVDLKGSVPWDDARKLHAFCVCMLLLTLELHTNLRSVRLRPQYPSFVERCKVLLDQFAAPESLRDAVDHFSYVIGVGGQPTMGAMSNPKNHMS
ncbi:hypothetical protein [Sinorhizobium medicae]|uniref:hypothetical protein n=1 Tax=Sinorhizobium medicae TaxID=110321 RepID=UPI000C7CEA1B|nr:hypothetical protein [Sinorhizobium medicae]MDX1158756.1 hypothetical protein [Sinorhizobium medicae]PLT91731.1 hypothetical protein BMJ35_07580 [Sinorhizobium medicae]